MKCNYCQERILGNYYTCSCDYNVVACSRCSQFNCYKCQKKPKKLQTQFCSSCHVFSPYHKVILFDFSKYCLECILKAYKSSKQKQIKINYHYFKRQQIEIFLFGFCVQCKRILKKEEKQNLSPLRGEHPLNFKRCHDCLVQQGERNKPEERIIKQESIHIERQKQNKLPLKYREKIKDDPPQSPQKKKEEYEALRKKWQQIQRTTILTCMSCERSIFHKDKPYLTQQMVICNLCSQMSKVQEKSINKLNNSRMISSFYDNRESNKKQQLSNKEKYKELQEPKAERQERIQIKQSIIQPMKQPINQPIKQPLIEPIKQSILDPSQQSIKQGRVEAIKQINPSQNIDDSKKALAEGNNIYQPIKAQKQSVRKQTVMIPVSETKQSLILPNVEVQKSVVKKQNKIPQRQPPGLKKCDSQKIIQAIQIQIKLINDQDLIECEECGIYIQPTSSIWQEQSNKPLCRCCFADLIRQLLQDQKKSYYGPKYENLKNKRRQYIQNIGSGNKKQNVIDMPKEYQVKQKYEQKKFINAREQSAKKARGVSMQQKQKLKQQLEEQERGKEKNMRNTSQGIKNIETWNQKIHLTSDKNKFSFNNDRMDLVDDIKKKMQQNQNKKLIDDKNNQFQLTSPSNNSYKYQIQPNTRYKSSQKPQLLQTSPQQPVSDSKPTHIQNSYLNSDPSIKTCSVCFKKFKSQKQYKINNNLVCLDCMTINSQRMNRLNGRPLGHK